MFLFGSFLPHLGLKDGGSYEQYRYSVLLLSLRKVPPCWPMFWSRLWGGTWRTCLTWSAGSLNHPPVIGFTRDLLCIVLWGWLSFLVMVNTHSLFDTWKHRQFQRRKWPEMKRPSSKSLWVEEQFTSRDLILPFLCQGCPTCMPVLLITSLHHPPISIIRGNSNVSLSCEITFRLIPCPYTLYNNLCLVNLSYDFEVEIAFKYDNCQTSWRLWLQEH